MHQDTIDFLECLLAEPLVPASVKAFALPAGSPSHRDAALQVCFLLVFSLWCFDAGGGMRRRSGSAQLVGHAGDLLFHRTSVPVDLALEGAERGVVVCYGGGGRGTPRVLLLLLVAGRGGA